VDIPVPLLRLAYRIAYRTLQVQWVVTRPRVQGVKCLLTDQDRVLLVRHTYGSRSWDVPGGRVKAGETPAAAAGREMGEELGLAGLGWEAFGELPVRHHHRHDTLHLFRCELSQPPLRLDLGELAEARWFPRAGLPGDLAPWVIPIIARTTVRRPG
jgi:8-oxo-dGTP diphosphatase